MNKKKLLKIPKISIGYEHFYELDELPETPNSEQAQKIFKTIWNKKTIGYIEEFYVMYLNRKHKVLGIKKISKGGTAGTVVDPKIVFQGALLANATGIILCHNHPSGVPKPSRSDTNLTNILVNAGKMLDITILDHLIITPTNSYYSYADERKI